MAKKTILLVEDSPDDEFLFLEVLRNSGISNPVVVLRDGDEAISYFKREGKYNDPEAFPTPSILFLDLRIPKADGFDVLRWVKSQPDLKDVLLVVVTNNSEVTSINRAYELGAHSFVIKPVTRAEFKNLTSHYQTYFKE